MKYIASQGPTPDTITDFWQMVWDENIAVIVMVTREIEGGKMKCEPFILFLVVEGPL